MVHDSEHGVSPGQPAADVANFGLIRPPFVYLGSIGLGLLVHWLWPVQLLPASVSVPIGVLVVLVAGLRLPLPFAGSRKGDPRSC